MHLLSARIELFCDLCQLFIVRLALWPDEVYYHTVMPRYTTTHVDQKHVSRTSNLYPDTLCRRTHVTGYKLLVRDTHWLYLGDIIILFIYVTVDLYHFVSSNRRATNWRQSKIHVDGDKWIQVNTTCIRQHVSWCKRVNALTIDVTRHQLLN